LRTIGLTQVQPKTAMPNNKSDQWINQIYRNKNSLINKRIRTRARS